ncbi:AGAP004076-PA-like protein [Anopheles sinensis]|uniref:AGAP004076-PA-like protein n=1 Tax=Anopheles sinensis TaxID=74873 RepID=A0A084VER5_ANOSI|nr:AGAP004076-PA-like protein [Anopheles sinensis]
MKHQQVVPDYVAMVKTSGTCLCLVFSGWVLFKLVQAIFWLPGYLEKNQGRLYKRIEHRSGVSVADGDKAEKSKDEEKRSTVEDDCDDEEKESVQSLEEKGENDAIECEADSKKDK